MIMLFIATTITVAAQSNKYAMSYFPFNQIESGSRDAEVVNQAGMKGKDLRLLLDAWAKYRGQGDLNNLINTGKKEKITIEHANTQALTTGLQTYWDKSPDGEVWGGCIKDECCNLVASSEGVIKNFLASYAKQISGQKSDVVTIPGGQPDQKEEEKEKNMNVDVNIKGVEAVTQQTNYGPWWLWLIGAIVLIVLALIFRPGARQRFMDSMRDAWRVEDSVLDRHEDRIRRSDRHQGDRNNWLYDESRRQEERYRQDRQTPR